MEFELDTETILNERGAKNRVLRNRPYLHLLEKELGANGTIENVATIFISNKECPFRCLMCDLWKNTTNESVTADELIEQVHYALNHWSEDQLEESQTIDSWKLYNSGNFFDEKAIPRDARLKISELANEHYDTSGLSRVIAECHPKLIGRTCQTFREMLRPCLEIAMGLETIHPQILPKLNKQMTLDDFRRATEFLLQNDIAVRAFVLLRTPWMSEEEGIEWALRSVEWAFEIGVQCCAVIPTRSGNGILERLETKGHFAEPKLESLERVQKEGLLLVKNGQRFFVDEWDAHRFSECEFCIGSRVERIRQANLLQRLEPEVPCPHCL